MLFYRTQIVYLNFYIGFVILFWKLIVVKFNLMIYDFRNIIFKMPLKMTIIYIT